MKRQPGNQTGRIDACAAALVCCFIAFFTWFTFREFRHGMLDPYDQATYAQALWNTLRGNFFWCSFTGSGGLCDLGVHMDPLLLLFLPVFAVFPSTIILSVVQVVLLGVGAVPLYLTAKDRISARAGLVFVAMYLTNTFVIHSVIEGFQARVLAVPLLFFSFYFLSRNRWLLFGVFTLLVCLSHEISCLLVFMLGVYVMFVRRKPVLGGFLSAASLGWFLLSTAVLQPYFGMRQPFGALNFLAGGESLGDPLSIARYCLLHPLEIAGRAFTAQKIDYLVRLFAPLGFLPLASPAELLIGLPVFLQNLVLSDRLTAVYIPRYTMPAFPCIFIAAIYSAGKLLRRVRGGWLYAGKAVVVFSWMASTYMFILNPRYDPRFLQIMAPPARDAEVHTRALRETALRVPQNASVCADLNAFHFLFTRSRLYDIPYHIDETEYVVIDRNRAFLSPKLGSGEVRGAAVERVLNSPEYELVGEEDGIALLRRTGAEGRR